MILMAVFMVLGALDRISGSRLGLGKEFENGILAFGSLALSMLGIICLVYLTPVVLFLLGYLLTWFLPSEGMRYAAASVAFVVGIIPAILYDRRVRRQGGLEFTIVRLF